MSLRGTLLEVKDESASEADAVFESLIQDVNSCRAAAAPLVRSSGVVPRRRRAPSDRDANEKRELVINEWLRGRAHCPEVREQSRRATGHDRVSGASPGLSRWVGGARFERTCGGVQSGGFSGGVFYS